MSTFLRFALEEIESIESEEIEGLDDIEETDVIEVDVDDSGDVEIEADKFEAAAELFEDAAEKLIEVKEEVEAALESGGLTAREAAMVAAQVRRITSRYDNSPEFATESFTHEGGRHEATIALEAAIGDKMKAAWDWVIRTIKGWISSAGKLWDRYLSNAAWMLRAAKAIASKAKEVGSKSAAKDKVKVNAATIKLLSTDGKFDAIGSLETISKLVSSARGVKSGAKAKALLDIMNKGSAIDGSDYADALDVAMSEGIEGAELVLGSRRKMGIKQDTAEVVGDSLPGGVHIRYIASLKNISGRWALVKDAKTKVEAAEVDTLTGSEITAIAKLAANIGNMIIAIKSSAREASDRAKKAISAAEKLSKATTAEDKQKHRYIKTVQWLALNAYQPGLMTFGHSVKVAKAALGYASVSLKAVGKEAKV